MQGHSKNSTANASPTILPVPPVTCRTFGEEAYVLIRKQVRTIFKGKVGVLKNTDPECLHQMRVATRRFRTALTLFNPVIELPKLLQVKALRRFARKLGKLRDLDVQLAALHESYHPRLLKQDDKTWRAVIDVLEGLSSRTFQKVQDLLTGEAICTWETLWQEWLENPTFKGCHALPIMTVLPDVLMPGLSRLLLHPAWQVSTEDLVQGSETALLIAGAQLHDLRKCCKQVRYQAEFFEDYYSSEFHQWIGQLKVLQDCLGQVQDAEVLLQLLQPHLTDERELPELHGLVISDRTSALQDWQHLRQDFLNPEFRYGLYSLVLQPNILRLGN